MQIGALGGLRAQAARRRGEPPRLPARTRRLPGI